MTKAERKAYNCRNRNGIKEFPITGDSMLQIMREMGYKVLLYSEANDLIVERKWEDCAANNPAFSCKIDGVFTVFVADDAADMTKSIAHELGHIEQGHTLDIKKPKDVRLEEDDDANEFTAFFLAPPCYLDKIGVKTLEALEEMLPYGHRLCKEIWANLTAWQQRHNPITYEEECICKMMGVDPQADAQEEPNPAPELNAEPVTEPELIPTPKAEKQVEIRYIPHPVPTPAPSINRNMQKLFVALGAVLAICICVICFMGGKLSNKQAPINYIPQPTQGQSYYIVQQPQDSGQSSVESSTPESVPESTPSQSEGRIVSSVEGEGTLVYVTTAGEKYHKWGCQYINNKTNLLDMYLSEAQDKGYQPCKICFPGQ